MARKRLGELLLERKVITPPQLDQALAYQRQTGHRLGAALVALGFLGETQLCEALAQALGLKAVQLPPEEVDWTALHSLRSRFCEANDLFPLAMDTSHPSRKTIVVAMADPLNIPAIEEIEFTTGFKVVAVIAPLTSIRQSIRRYYLKDAGPQHGDRTTGVRPGGSEQAPPNSSARGTSPSPSPSRPAKASVSKPPASSGSRTEENEMPVLADNELLEWHEVTERTALADLIRARAEKQKKKKSPPDSSSVDEDLAYLFGVKAQSPSDEIARLESKLWALLRIMAKKGLITREEFLQELSDKDE
ncbi:MAG: general secretion pathway protein GspE [Deltaproteobacteria bacterium]|nr:general secretion pathway protein GspE [Deltaproteobacteria bacterium]